MKWKKYVLCVCAGVFLFLCAELADSRNSSVEKGMLYRNPCGKGDAVYEFYVDGLGEEKEKMSLTVPEQQMSEEQFSNCVPEIVELLCERMAGENVSLGEVRTDLDLETELPEYGVTVSWQSRTPGVVSRTGTVNGEQVSESGETVVLEATLFHGNFAETVEIPVIVFPGTRSLQERFSEVLEQVVFQNGEGEYVYLPSEFEQRPISYRSASHSQNLTLVFLGIVAAGCLRLKENSDMEELKKRREDSLVAGYHDLVSGFLILTGAGYSTKAAFKKLTKDMEDAGKIKTGALLTEMRTTVNQMDTGTAEIEAYAAFGRRCGVRCYTRFASLLESSVSTGGKNLRKLLEAEMEESFKQRTDLARRKGEEASSKLLLPLFGMLGVVLVMVVAPAFLSLY